MNDMICIERSVEVSVEVKPNNHSLEYIECSFNTDSQPFEVNWDSLQMHYLFYRLTPLSIMISYD